jgi:hypothetical protein
LFSTIDCNNCFPSCFLLVITCSKMYCNCYSRLWKTCHPFFFHCGKRVDPNFSKIRGDKFSTIGCNLLVYLSNDIGRDGTESHKWIYYYESIKRELLFFIFKKRALLPSPASLRYEGSIYSGCVDAGRCMPAHWCYGRRGVVGQLGERH